MSFRAWRPVETRTYRTAAVGSRVGVVVLVRGMDQILEEVVNDGGE